MTEQEIFDLLEAVAATCAEWKRVKYKVGVHAELDRYITLMQTLDTLTEKAGSA